MVENQLDHDPQRELWLARLSVLILYGLEIFVIGTTFQTAVAGP
jgi:hypothetical protein